MKTELQINGETSTSTLDVVVAYDDVQHAKQVKELCDRLEQKLASDCELNLIFWNISALQFPQLSQVALNETHDACLLIVVVQGDAQLSPTAERFLTRCAHSVQAAHGALVAQLHGILKMDEDLSPVYCLLNRIAQVADLPFFSKVITSPEEELDSYLDAIHERAEMRTPVL